MRDEKDSILSMNRALEWLHKKEFHKNVPILFPKEQEKYLQLLGKFIKWNAEANSIIKMVEKLNEYTPFEDYEKCLLSILIYQKEVQSEYFPISDINQKLESEVSDFFRLGIRFVEDLSNKLINYFSRLPENADLEYYDLKILNIGLLFISAANFSLEERHNFFYYFESIWLLNCGKKENADYARNLLKESHLGKSKKESEFPLNKKLLVDPILSLFSEKISVEVRPNLAEEPALKNRKIN